MQGPSRFAIALIVLGVVAVAIVALGLLSWQSLVFQTHQVNVEIASKQNDLRSITQELTHKPELKLQLVKLTDELGNIDRDMVDYEYVPTYLRQIETAAKESGNYLQSIQPSDPKPLDLTKPPFATPKDAGSTGSASGTTPAPAAAPPAPPKPQVSTEKIMRIGLDVKGNYISVMKFLDKLRNFQKLIYVKTVSLSPVKNPDGSIGVNARFETYAIIPGDQYKTPEDRKPVTAGGAKP